MSNPFATSAIDAETVETVETVETPTTEEVVEETTITNEAEETTDTSADAPQKKKRTRKQRDPNKKKIDREMGQYIVKNFATKSADEIAHELEIDKNDVNIFVSDFRKVQRGKIETFRKEGNTAEADKLEAMLARMLPSKRKQKGEGPSAREQLVEDIFADIMSDFE